MSARAAWWVGAGILLSRMAGFVREAVFANFFGVGAVADVWRAALRTPNVIQNLLGEGTLSASLIPVYAELVEQGREEDAGRFAGAALGILATAAFGAALVGILLSPILIRLFFPEWEPWQHELGIGLVRILFLMAATLSVSAWALGILNSHRRFFVSYTAPVAWNGAMIATMVFLGGRFAGDQVALVVALAWGALAGGVLQLLVQLPWVVPVLRHFRLSLSRDVVGVRTAVRNFVPVVAARGVVNVSGWLDIILAGLLATGAQASLGYAQALYILPISLFGMSIAASELPELSRQREGAREVVAFRVETALRRVTFLIVPSTLAYLALGDVLVAALYERGAFGPGATALVYAVLAAYSLGLLASSRSRVLSSAYYALRDTRTPARIAYVRVGLSLVAGLALMFPLDQVAVTLEGETRRFGAVGLALGASLGAWTEYLLLRRRLLPAIGPHAPPRGVMARILAAGLVSLLVGLAAKLALGSRLPFRTGLVHAALGPEHWAAALLVALGTALALGVSYLAVASLLGVGVPLRRRPRA